MRRGQRGIRRTVLGVIIVLCVGLLLAGIYAAVDRVFPEPLPEAEPEPPLRVPVDVAPELEAAVLLEMILEGEPPGAVEKLMELALRDDAVGYTAALELARRSCREGEDAVRWYLRALDLHDTAEVRRQLADHLVATGRHQEAYEHYLQLLPDTEVLEVVGMLAPDPLTLAADLNDRRLWDSSREVLEPAPEEPDAEWMGLYARALLGQEKYGEAQQWLGSYLQQHPGDEDMRWWYARCLEAAGRYGEALEIYEELGPGGSHRRGIILQRQGRLQEAAEAFAASPGVEERWSGARMLEQLGRSSDALAVYLELSGEAGAPRDDAAFRAHVLLDRAGDPRADEMLEILKEYPAWMVRLDLEPEWEEGEELEPEGDTFLARMLAYQDTGRAELAELELAIARDFGEPAELLALGEWHLEEERFFSAAMLGIRVLREHRCRRTYRLAYPRPYPELVREASGDYRLEPHLVLAVMREESMFRPAVVSWAGACGLMQVMPATGRDIASRKGVQFEREDLFCPETNIRFGAFYLRAMLDMFGGDIDRALAAYNAGPGNVQRWVDSPLGQDPLGFPTAVAFIETRQYITRVRNTQHIYDWLYGETE